MKTLCLPIAVAFAAVSNPAAALADGTSQQFFTVEIKEGRVARPRSPVASKMTGDDTAGGEKPGAPAPKSRSAHVAISLGDGTTIEARGSEYRQHRGGAPDRPIVAGRIYNPADDLPPPPTLAERGSPAPQTKRGLANFSANIGDHLKGSAQPDAPKKQYPGLVSRFAQGPRGTAR
jgi:hypothetical protein